MRFWSRSSRPGYDPSIFVTSTCTDGLGILIEAGEMGRDIQDRKFLCHPRVMHSFDLPRALIGSRGPTRVGARALSGSMKGSGWVRLEISPNVVESYR